MEIKGLYTAIVTPFKRDGSLDKDGLRKIIEYQVRHNVDGIIPCSVSGESATLSYNEHDWVVELTVKYVNQRAQVIAAAGSNSTREAVRLSRHAQKTGADAVFLVTPYLNIPTQRGLYLHFKTIADDIELPCILHNLKTQTNVNLETDTLLRLADECPNIIGICEVGDTLEQAKEILALKPPRFTLLAGRDDQALEVIRQGGGGLVSLAANIVPHQIRRMIRHANNNEFDIAEKICQPLDGLFKILQLQPDPVPVKTLLAQMDLCEASFRLPICGFEDDRFDAQMNMILKSLKQSNRE